uniref:Cytochrome P450 n=1 Tax=Polyporus umbellatus TaxID=158314 RepID=A0A160HLD2_9APHY|nr:cytochrome P450 [Polyporus umbellatus]
MSFALSAWLWGPALLILAVLLVNAISFPQNAARLRLPPGPKCLPLIGNALDVPRDDLGRKWSAISKKYGDVVYLNVLGQPIVALGSLKAATDLLDKRSANYSDRPTSIMAELVGYTDWLFVLMGYGPEWRHHRRMFHQVMNIDIIKGYQATQINVVRNLLRHIRQAPQGLGQHLEFAFAAIVMRVIYGVELTEASDKYFKMVKLLSDVGEDIAVPGRYLVEAIPWLRFLPSWFPGVKFKKFAADANRDMGAMVEDLFANARIAMNSGDTKDSAATRLLADIPSDDTQAEEMYQRCKGVMATTYAAGADTTNAAMRAFCLAMALYPDAQSKAQAEIDAVVGTGRPPEFCDRPSLPYINALLKEVLRWHIVTPIAVPHRTVADDIYDGYLIPGGATVIANSWAMSRDPTVFPDPDEFKPERFLDENGRFDCEGKDPADFVFGFGRRICPGREFADTTLFIFCASVLWAFNIKPPVDERGLPREINRKINTHGVVAHVEGSDYTIEVRSPNVDRLILETF